MKLALAIGITLYCLTGFSLPQWDNVEEESWGTKYSNSQLIVNTYKNGAFRTTDLPALYIDEYGPTVTFNQSNLKVTSQCRTVTQGGGCDRRGTCSSPTTRRVFDLNYQPKNKIADGRAYVNFNIEKIQGISNFASSRSNCEKDRIELLRALNIFDLDMSARLKVSLSVTLEIAHERTSEVKHNQCLVKVSYRFSSLNFSDYSPMRSGLDLKTDHGASSETIYNKRCADFSKYELQQVLLEKNILKRRILRRQ